MDKKPDATWYAVYTRPRNEKKIAEMLERSRIEHYLPLLRTLKKWSDRRKLVEEPLFKSYLFVKITEKEHLAVLQIHGVVRFITFLGKKVPVPEVQIEAIKEYLGSEMAELPVDDKNYKPGKKVMVTKGAMKGLEGRLVEILGKQRVKVQIDAVNQSVYIDVPKNSLEITGDAEEGKEVRYW